jgi:hypothetical protein
VHLSRNKQPSELYIQYGVIDEACDVLNDMKNKDTFKSPHGNGLCDARNILEAFKLIARHVAIGTVWLNRNLDFIKVN